MAEQVINNGSFDNDGSAEKIRLAFQKVKEMFAEIYAQIPFEDSDISGKAGQFLRVNAGETATEWASVPGGGDLISTNNLSDVSDASQARTNLGLGTSAVADLIDEDSMATNSATQVPSQQSVKAYVDAQVLDYQAGTGISIQTTSPYSTAAPGIVNTQTNVNVNAAAFAPSTGILTLTLTNAATVTVDLSAYTVLKIDGYTVEKGSGNTDFANIEVGDFVEKWVSTTRFIKGRVTALPYTTEGNIAYVIDNETL